MEEVDVDFSDAAQEGAPLLMLTLDLGDGRSVRHVVGWGGQILKK